MSAETDKTRSGGIPNGTTLCVNCVFATWDGNSQSGCEFGRIEAFERAGTDIAAINDVDLTFFAILGRFCNACRDSAWGKRHPRQEWASLVAREFAVRVHFIVYVDDNTSFDEACRTIDTSLDQGDVKPSGIAVVINGGVHEPRDFVRAFRGRDLDIPWNVKQVTPDDDGRYPGYGHAIDQAVQEIGDRVTFYAVARGGYAWPADYLDVINVAINRRMMRFVALLPDDGDSGLLMDVRLHKHLLDGNRGRGVVDKLLSVAEEQRMGHMIRTWREVGECVSPA